MYSRWYFRFWLGYRSRSSGVWRRVARYRYLCYGSATRGPTVCIMRLAVTFIHSLFAVTRQAMYVQRNNEARSSKHCYCGTAISTTCCECVFVALVIRHAKRMRHIFICGLSGCNNFFHIISQMVRFFWGGVEGNLLNIKCVFWFSVQCLSETFLILRRFQRDIITNVLISSCKIKVILVRF
jgi:hypothetical protein